MLPSISVIIPVLNSERVLDMCLQAIRNQDYPSDLIEIIIADGGSTDRSLEIAQEYGAKIHSNPLKTGEAGKAVGIKNAKNELIALIDSDNILPDKDWFKKMVNPFQDPEIIGSEPWEYTYRREDGFIDRYCALLGMNDPICLFVGNYDRKSVLTGEWTGLKVEQEDKGNWLKLNLCIQRLPTIGANGTFFRKKILLDQGQIGNYFFDIDILALMLQKGSAHFAKVKVGIIHLFCGTSIKQFNRKQKRRIRDFLYYNHLKVRKYPWKSSSKWSIAKFSLFAITWIVPFIQSVSGYRKVKDRAWFFHPLACWLTFWQYSVGTLKSFFVIRELDRSEWRQ